VLSFIKTKNRKLLHFEVENCVFLWYAYRTLFQWSRITFLINLNRSKLDKLRSLLTRYWWIGSDWQGLKPFIDSCKYIHPTKVFLEKFRVRNPLEEYGILMRVKRKGRYACFKIPLSKARRGRERSSKLICKRGVLLTVELDAEHYQEECVVW